jgi:hypothetical protein
LAAFVGGNCIRTNPIIIPATAIIRKNAAFAVISATKQFSSHNFKENRKVSYTELTSRGCFS